MGVEYRYIKDGKMVMWLHARPAYCDRGRWDAHINVPVWHSGADPWPRYYFDLERGMLELIEYLKIKHAGGHLDLTYLPNGLAVEKTDKVDYRDGHWEKVTYNEDQTETSIPFDGPVWKSNE